MSTENRNINDGNSAIGKSNLYDNLMRVGEKIRENENDPWGAIQFFQLAVSKATTTLQIVEAMCQIGLCYGHMNKINNALSTYVNALIISEETKDKVGNILAKTYLSSARLREGEIERASELALDAYNILCTLPKEEIPNYAAWVVHGVVKTLIEEKKPRSEIRKWTKIEHRYLKEAQKKKKNSTQLKVWTADWMMDTAYAWAPLGWIFLPAAYYLYRITKIRWT